MIIYRWYVSSILKGTQQRRRQLRRYIALISTRLSELGCTVFYCSYLLIGPTPVHYADCIHDYPLEEGTQVDMVVFINSRLL